MTPVAADPRAEERRRDLTRLLAVLLALLGLALVLVYVAALDAGTDAGLAGLAHQRLPQTGVQSPVTAVLFGFRAYDTLLDLAVLLAALLGIWSFGPAAPGRQRPTAPLASRVSWLVPLLIVAAAYLLGTGSDGRGGAVPAGGLLAASGVSLYLAGDPRAGLPAEAAQRWLLVLGLLVVTGLGLGLMGFGAGFLTYPPQLARWLILLLQTAVTFAIGVTLAAAYVGGRPGAAP